MFVDSLLGILRQSLHQAEELEAQWVVEDAFLVQTLAYMRLPSCISREEVTTCCEKNHASLSIGSIFE
jgi:hypothetical protein